MPSVGGRTPRSLPREVLANIIEPRVEEIFAAVQHVLNESGYIDMLNAGVVLTGGSTMLDGMAELAEEILGMPVFDNGRVYVTAGGDLWWGKRQSWLKCINAAAGAGDVTGRAEVWSYPLSRETCCTPAVRAT